MKGEDKGDVRSGREGEKREEVRGNERRRRDERRRRR